MSSLSLLPNSCGDLSSLPTYRMVFIWNWMLLRNHTLSILVSCANYLVYNTWRLISIHLFVCVCVCVCVVLGFELRSLHLLDRCSTTFSFSYFSCFFFFLALVIFPIGSHLYVWVSPDFEPPTYISHVARSTHLLLVEMGAVVSHEHWPWTTILPMSTSRVTGTTGVEPQCPGISIYFSPQLHSTVSFIFFFLGFFFLVVLGWTWGSHAC
jgi:hypothetical protein